MNAADSPKCYVLRIYSADRASEMSTLAERLTEAVKSVAKDGSVTVEVVDVLSDPERAVADQVIATPTLIKELPEPVGRVLGDLSDPRRVLFLLGVVLDQND